MAADFDERVPVGRGTQTRGPGRSRPRRRLLRAGPQRTPCAREWVEVRWHLVLPEDSRAGALRRQRVVRLAREAAEQGALPTVDDLAQALGVNAKTIKRDLAALRAAGQAVRTRGAR
jgi:hypothetical protein